MTLLTRRAFLAQALLLPAAAVLPALPEVAPVAEWVEGKIWVNEIPLHFEPDFNPSLAFTEGLNRSNHWANLQMGIENNIDALLAQTQEVVQVMIEQIEEGMR